MSFRQKVFVSVVLCFPLSGYAANPKISSEVTSAHNILAEFKVARQGDPILLPVKFKGKKYLFLLDTGCSITTFDISLRPELGVVKEIAITETGGGDMIETPLFDAPETFLGPLNLRDCGQVICVDIGMFSLISGREISGALGMNFLKKCVVQIDFDKGRLVFIQPTDSPDPGWGEELGISYCPLGAPYITGTLVGNVDVDFLIDTGLTYTGDLETKIFKDVLKDRVMKTSENIVQVVDDLIQGISFRTDDLTVGPLQYKGLILDVSHESGLGLGFLSRHLVTFDFPNSKIYFKKGKDFKKTDEVDMSGLHLLRMSNKTIVHSVDKNSPAEKAGIKANDIILSIGNKDVNKYDMWKLRRFLMSGDKQKVTMTIKHGTDVRKVSFLLEKKI